MTVAEFHEEWFGEYSIEALERLAVLTADVPGDVIEIGSWEGRSTVALANAVHPRIVHAIDTWVGSPGEPSETLAAERDVFGQWQANIAEWTEGNVEAHEMGWRDYDSTEPVAFLFIDAAHTYREVADTITRFLPLLSAGGIICGDDWHHPPVSKAVRRYLPGSAWAASVWFWRNDQ